MQTHDLDLLYTRYLQCGGVVSTDTRNLPAGCMFFALKGPNFNANSLAPKALAQGAAFAVIDEVPESENECFILVQDVLQTLQQLANYHRRQLKIPFLAITGSNGKTTTKELVREVLSKKFRTLATKGNLNNHIGVPLTLLSIRSDIEFAVIEMGANKQGDIEELANIAEPDFGIITNIGKAHLEGFGGLDGVARGKSELYYFLFRRKGLAFVNGNQQKLVELSNRLENVITYGSNQLTLFSPIQIKVEMLAFNPTVIFALPGRSEVVTHLGGTYNFENIMTAIAVGKHFGVNDEGIETAIAAYAPDNMRSQIIEKGSNRILMDAYNANPTSMEHALRNFSLAEHNKKVVILGDMFELGTEGPAEHQRVADTARGLGFERVLFAGSVFSKVLAGQPDVYATTADLISEVKNSKFENTFILIKGSRSMRLEEVLEHL